MDGHRGYRWKEGGKAELIQVTVQEDAKLEKPIRTYGLNNENLFVVDPSPME